MKLIGKFHKTNFLNPNTFYLEGLFDIKDVKYTKVKGTFYDRNIDLLLEYELSGSHINNKEANYFKFDSYKTIMPIEPAKVIEYLTSNSNFKSFSKKEIELVVNQVGHNTLLKLYKNGENELIKSKLDQNKKHEFVANVFKVYHRFGIEQELMKLGLKPKMAQRLVNEIIKDNDPIMFLKNSLDNLFWDEKINFSEFKTLFFLLTPDNKRVLYSVATYAYIDEQVYETKSTLFIKNNIFAKIKKQFDQDLTIKIEDDVLENVIHQLIRERHIVEIGESIILDYFYKFEQDTFNYLQKLHSASNVNFSSNYSTNWLTDFIGKYEKKHDIILDKYQHQVIYDALTKPFLIVSGGPGTGKSMLISLLCNIFVSLYGKDSVALLAPTGRVAKLIGRKAKTEGHTFHSHYVINPFEIKYSIPTSCPEQIIIIDEFSMVGLIIFLKMFQGSPKIRKLIVFGDVNQLPSIDPGNLLMDLTSSGKYPISYLKENHRQGAGSLIAKLASSIIEANSNASLENPLSNIANGEEIKTYFISDEEIVGTINQIYIDNNISPTLLNWQVIAPMKAENRLGNTSSINTILQQGNKNRTGFRTSNKSINIFKLDDKVINNKNNYQEDIYNGDIGTIKSVELSDQKIEHVNITFDEEIKSFETEWFKEHVSLGYAITIHKAQGSEFENVIMVVPRSAVFMLNINLIYTAISRATKKLFIVGNKEQLEKSVNKKEKERTTWFSKLLNK